VTAFINHRGVVHAVSGDEDMSVHDVDPPEKLVDHAEHVHHDAFVPGAVANRIEWSKTQNCPFPSRMALPMGGSGMVDLAA